MTSAILSNNGISVPEEGVNYLPGKINIKMHDGRLQRRFTPRGMERESSIRMRVFGHHSDHTVPVLTRWGRQLNLDRSDCASSFAELIDHVGDNEDLIEEIFTEILGIKASLRVKARRISNFLSRILVTKHLNDDRDIPSPSSNGSFTPVEFLGVDKTDMLCDESTSGRALSAAYQDVMQGEKGGFGRVRSVLLIINEEMADSERNSSSPSSLSISNGAFRPISLSGRDRLSPSPSPLLSFSKELKRIKPEDTCGMEITRRPRSASPNFRSVSPWAQSVSPSPKASSSLAMERPIARVSIVPLFPAERLDFDEFAYLSAD
jgi:hypothetical protein